MSLVEGGLEHSLVRAHPAGVLTVSGVCGLCNSGWMSKLEVEVKSFLPDLANHRSMLFELSRSERHILVRWVLKTALMLELATPEHELRAPKQWLSVLRAGGFPLHVAVYAGLGKMQGIGSAQGVQWWIVPEDGFAPAVFEDSEFGYKASFHVGAAYFVIAEIPSSPHVHMIWRDIHMPLWPPAHMTASFSLSPGWFQLAAPKDAVVMYADSLNLASYKWLGKTNVSGWAGGTPPRLPRTLTADEARTAHQSAGVGPYVWSP